MRPAGRISIAATLVAAVACFELSDPGEGVTSISSIDVPWPSVAVGDTMRDSTGAVAPLRVVAFDANGDTVRDASATFTVLDTGLTVDAAGLVRGGQTALASAVRVIATVEVLQSPIANIRVVPRPTAVRDTMIRPADSTAARYPPPSAFSDTTLGPFGFRVLSGTTGVPAWLVRFRLLRSTFRPIDAASPVVTLETDEGRSSLTDTTNADGMGLIRLRIQPIRIEPASFSPSRVDTVEVEASTVLGTAPRRRVFRIVLQAR